MKKFKKYTATCKFCDEEFSYERRVQTKGRFAGNYMGRARIGCDKQSCVKAKRHSYAEAHHKKLKAKKRRKQRQKQEGRPMTGKHLIATNCFKLLGVPVEDEYVPNTVGGVALTVAGFKALEEGIQAIVDPPKDKDILIEELQAIIEELNELANEEELELSVSLKVRDN